MDRRKAKRLAQRFENLMKLMNDVRKELGEFLEESERSEETDFLKDILYGELKISFPEAQEWLDDVIYTLETGKVPVSEMDDEEDEP